MGETREKNKNALGGEKACKTRNPIRREKKTSKRENLNNKSKMEWLFQARMEVTGSTPKRKSPVKLKSTAKRKGFRGNGFSPVRKEKRRASSLV